MPCLRRPELSEADAVIRRRPADRAPVTSEARRKSIASVVAPGAITRFLTRDRRSQPRALSPGRFTAQTSNLNTACAVLVLFTCACVFLVLSMAREVNVYDEGLILVGAARVLAGDVIHRDFYANYGPGQFYALSALFWALPPLMLVERGWDLAIRA